MKTVQIVNNFKSRIEGGGGGEEEEKR